MALTFMAIVAKAAMSNRSADDMSTIRCRDRQGSVPWWCRMG